jgi:sugar phosphate permease
MVQAADDPQSLRPFTPALILLAICILINYVDRGNLSIAAPLLKDELGISASQLGILLAAFFGLTQRCSLSAAGSWTALT